jgi:hypothetical protein
VLPHYLEIVANEVFDIRAEYFDVILMVRSQSCFFTRFKSWHQRTVKVYQSASHGVQSEGVAGK